MIQEFYRNVPDILEENSGKIIFFAIVALLVLAYIRTDRKYKQRYKKMMSSVMTAPGNRYTGSTDNSYVWENNIDTATVCAYTKDYIRLKLRNLWGVIKIFVIIFVPILGIPLIWNIYKGGTFNSYLASIKGFLIPVLLMFLMIVVIYLLSSSSKMIIDDSVVYRELVSPMVRCLFGADAVYSRTMAMDSAKLKKLNFYEHIPDEIKGSDYISGVYKGVPFECAYENAEYTEKDGDGDSHSYLVFRGMMLAIRYRKISSSMLGLRGRTEQEIKDRKGMQSFFYRIDKTENEKFNRLFFIMSQDEKNLYYMLTPDTMEKLITLYENFGGFSEKLHVCFNEDMLYIGVPLGNYMRHKSLAPSAGALEKVQQKLWNDLNLVRAVLDLALTF